MFNKRQSGQTLVVVIFAMLLALTVGVVTSTRYLTQLHSVTRSDDSNRAIAAAEALVERMLLLPSATLDSYIANNNCGSNCHLVITGGDNVQAVADVVLSYVGNSSSSFTTDAKTTKTTDINLKGYPNNTALWICWNSPASGDKPSIEGMYIYGTRGSYTTDTYAYNAVGSVHSENKFSNAAANYGYTSCFSITGRTNPADLRLKAYYADATVAVIPTNNSLIPKQGILITSTAVVSDVTKVVKVMRSSSTVPTQFDYALYQTSDDDNLSN